jgi:hypothetical protein
MARGILHVRTFRRSSPEDEAPLRISVGLWEAERLARETAPAELADAPLRCALVKRCPRTRTFSVVEMYARLAEGPDEP